MKERPILFSGPMVKAILSGAKTQTRRIVPVAEVDAVALRGLGDGLPRFHWPPKYGEVGDRLWVKETLRRGPRAGSYDTAFYPADGVQSTLDTWPWKRNVLPAIHCPRGLSRIDLEIVAKERMQLIQEISADDCESEGIDAAALPGHLSDKALNEMRTRDAFHALWDSINGKRKGAAWADNPLVRVIEFRPVSRG